MLQKVKMLKHKKVRQKGKLSLGKYFQELDEGQKVALVRNLSYPAGFPSRMQGKTGTIIQKRGKGFVIALNDGKKLKKFTITREHIKKIK